MYTANNSINKIKNKIFKSHTDQTYIRSNIIIKPNSRSPLTFSHRSRMLIFRHRLQQFAIRATWTFQLTNSFQAIFLVRNNALLSGKLHQSFGRKKIIHWMISDLVTCNFSLGVSETTMYIYVCLLILINVFLCVKHKETVKLCHHDTISRFYTLFL